MTTATPTTPPGAAPSRTGRLGFYLPGTALTILAMLTLGFVVHLTLVSHLQYARGQQTLYSDYRAELARGTAPVGQTRLEFTDGIAGDERIVETGSPVAVLRIPAIGLRAVVLEGSDAEVLRDGPGHRRDTVLPGQPGTSVVMGRQAAYGGPFRDLDLLIPGDLVTVVTGQGEHSYRVTGTRRPGDPTPPRLASGAGRLTLITADGDRYLPQDLLRVDADLVSPAQPAPARRFGAASLPAAEQPMATDPDAWTPLMLWSQALLLATLAVAYLRGRWGGWPAWTVGVPLVAALGGAAADQVARLLPNLL
ncbi:MULTISPECIES: class E sortase [Polymorphospora]|uniref:Class E sortase n=1 Tax=Polymorphospora lycopeni TaxID=3140240 RepID=A0ABV5D0Y4_9ACTN